MCDFIFNILQRAPIVVLSLVQTGPLVILLSLPRILAMLLPRDHPWTIIRLSLLALPLQRLRPGHHIPKPRIAFMHPRAAGVGASSWVLVTLRALAGCARQRTILTRLTGVARIVPPLLVAVYADWECVGRWIPVEVLRWRWVQIAILELDVVGGSRLL
jgi:hypothetical protein